MTKFGLLQDQRLRLLALGIVLVSLAAVAVYRAAFAIPVPFVNLP
jgi:hypothetical protein